MSDDSNLSAPLPFPLVSSTEAYQYFIDNYIGNGRYFPKSELIHHPRFAL